MYTELKTYSSNKNNVNKKVTCVIDFNIRCDTS